MSLVLGAMPEQPGSGLPGLSYEPQFLPAGQADCLFQHCLVDLNWKHEEISLFGRKVKQPRLTCWYGDPEAKYRYSGLSLEPLAWTPALQELRQQLQQYLQVPFNSVLANAYRNGRDSMGWHSDDEPELGCAPVIASLSLGQNRRFLVRQRIPKARSSHLELGHGSLLVMQGDFQSRYQHAVPKTARSVGHRINLTFRYVHPSAGSSSD